MKKSDRKFLSNEKNDVSSVWWKVHPYGDAMDLSITLNGDGESFNLSYYIDTSYSKSTNVHKELHSLASLIDTLNEAYSSFEDSVVALETLRPHTKVKMKELVDFALPWDEVKVKIKPVEKDTKKKTVVKTTSKKN
jgi:hypothetical protein